MVSGQRFTLARMLSVRVGTVLMDPLSNGCNAVRVAAFLARRPGSRRDQSLGYESRRHLGGTEIRCGSRDPRILRVCGGAVARPTRAIVGQRPRGEAYMGRAGRGGVCRHRGYVSLTLALDVSRWRRREFGRSASVGPHALPASRRRGPGSCEPRRCARTSGWLCRGRCLVVLVVIVQTFDWRVDLTATSGALHHPATSC